MNLPELFSVMNILYAVTGGIFIAGLGVTSVAFGMSYISQKVAMWIDVRKLVHHRNALLEEVKALRVQITTLEAFNGKSDKVVSPEEIGVQVMELGKLKT